MNTRTPRIASTPCSIDSFEAACAAHQVPLERLATEVLQVNVGKLCNQACLHCHVEAGPKRTELMTEQTAVRVIELLKSTESITTLDITGGAPEMNPVFRDLVRAGRKRELRVIDRCNLTIFSEPGHEDLPTFLREYRVDVIASLPCYTADNVEAQRGTGVFKKSIAALQQLNSLGYGIPGSDLVLDLVYNPVGASLPPDQIALEADYKKRLFADFDISFNGLYTITNMPISRFLHYLEREGKYEDYMQLLATNFNPHAARNVMCRSLISIGWDGALYDCDFNQMLELGLKGDKALSIWDIDSLNELQSLPIVFDQHCYGCSAGAGSSCSGSLA